MKISDYLKPWIAKLGDDRKRQTDLNDDLRSWIQERLVQPGYQYFAWLMDKKYKIGPHKYYPGNLVMLCSEIGLVEIEDFFEWISAFDNINVQAMIDLADHNVDHSLLNADIMPRVDYQTVMDLYNQPHPGCLRSIDFGNLDYPLMTTEQLRYVISVNPSDTFKYIPKKRECEAFVAITKGWMARQGLYDHLIGYCDYLGYGSDGKLLICHAVNTAVVDVGDNIVIPKAVLFEPQRDYNSIWPANEPSGNFAGVERIKLRTVRF